jgi:hypothetical protein
MELKSLIKFYRSSLCTWLGPDAKPVLLFSESESDSNYYHKMYPSAIPVPALSLSIPGVVDHSVTLNGTPITTHKRFVESCAEQDEIAVNAKLVGVVDRDLDKDPNNPRLVCTDCCDIESTLACYYPDALFRLIPSNDDAYHWKVIAAAAAASYQLNLFRSYSVALQKSHSNGSEYVGLLKHLFLCIKDSDLNRPSPDDQWNGNVCFRCLLKDDQFSLEGFFGAYVDYFIKRRSTFQTRRDDLMNVATLKDDATRRDFTDVITRGYLDYASQISLGGVPVYSNGQWADIASLILPNCQGKGSIEEREAFWAMINGHYFSRFLQVLCPEYGKFVRTHETPIFEEQIRMVSLPPKDTNYRQTKMNKKISVLLGPKEKEQ